jgi:hypothetical protein
MHTCYFFQPSELAWSCVLHKSRGTPSSNWYCAVGSQIENARYPNTITCQINSLKFFLFSIIIQSLWIWMGFLPRENHEVCTRWKTNLNLIDCPLVSLVKYSALRNLKGNVVISNEKETIKISIHFWPLWKCIVFECQKPSFFLADTGSMPSFWAVSSPRVQSLKKFWAWRYLMSRHLAILVIMKSVRNSVVVSSQKNNPVIKTDMKAVSFTQSVRIRTTEVQRLMIR